MLLTGIIYIHRIMDVRLTGAAITNLRMFKKLCGPAGLGNVVLATTFWDTVAGDIGTRREEELLSKPEFWARMVSSGSRSMRHDSGRQSALTIISSLIEQNQPIAMQVQTELVDKGLTLDQTAAGQEVQAELERIKADNERAIKQLKEDYEQAVKEKDQEWQEELARQRTEVEENMQRNAQSTEKLRVDFSDLQKNYNELQYQLAKAEEKRQALKVEHRELRLEAEALRQRLDKMDHKNRRSSGARTVKMKCGYCRTANWVRSPSDSEGRCRCGATARLYCDYCCRTTTHDCA
jgi:hypothetical protein